MRGNHVTSGGVTRCTLFTHCISGSSFFGTCSHVFRQRAAGDRTRHGGNVCWPTRRASTPKPRGEDLVADLADTAPDTLEPFKGKCTIQVATQMVVVVTFHGAKSTPTTASEGAMIRTRRNRAEPATGGGGTTLGKRRFGRPWG